MPAQPGEKDPRTIDATLLRNLAIVAACALLALILAAATLSRRMP